MRRINIEAKKKKKEKLSTPPHNKPNRFHVTVAWKKIKNSCVMCVVSIKQTHHCEEYKKKMQTNVDQFLLSSIKMKKRLTSE